MPVKPRAEEIVLRALLREELTFAQAAILLALLRAPARLLERICAPFLEG